MSDSAAWRKGMAVAAALGGLVGVGGVAHANDYNNCIQEAQTQYQHDIAWCQEVLQRDQELCRTSPCNPDPEQCSIDRGACQQDAGDREWRCEIEANDWEASSEGWCWVVYGNC
jgi:hypothetical protein